MNRFFLRHCLLLAVIVSGLGGLAYLDACAMVQDAKAFNSTVLNRGAEVSRMSMVSDHFDLHWAVLANGGLTMTSSHFQLSGTIGQPAIGNAGSSHFKLRSGYWQDFFYRVFLPLVLRN